MQANLAFNSAATKQFWEDFRRLTTYDVPQPQMEQIIVSSMQASGKHHFPVPARKSRYQKDLFFVFDADVVAGKVLVYRFNRVTTREIVISRYPPK